MLTAWVRHMLPEAASSLAPSTDHLFAFIFWLSLFWFVVIQGVLLFFVLKYRNNRTVYPAFHNVTLEVIWTVVPTLLVMVLFVYGWRVFRQQRQIPDDALEIHVTGRQWLWEFRYPDGRTLVNELVVPLGRDVRLVMQSADVLHSFYVPAFRVKQDLLPDRYTELWFRPTVADTFEAFCAEYCGASHSGMLARVVVLPSEAYASWKQQTATALSAGGEDPVALGRRIYETRGCKSCHSLDGQRGVGPTFLNLYGHEVALESGEVVRADENYLRESILDPQRKVVKGFQPVMPPFQGILSDAEVDAVIAFLRSLSESM
ncbi:MAG: cytochrome c oxidase subunit II [Candidatus Hydrothermae bacterium]|nr:cytochrome c oxidase subunit II [Candidatus Hydrothermae bacterium]